MQIDFYVTPASQFSAALNLLATLVKKAYKQSLAVYIQCPNMAIAQQVDDILWGDDISFIPHEVVALEKPHTTHIHIGHGTKAPDSNIGDILINIDSQIPSWHAQFKRIIEIVVQDPEEKRVRREHYQFYKDQGYDLKSHTL